MTIINKQSSRITPITFKFMAAAALLVMVIALLIVAHNYHHDLDDPVFRLFLSVF